MYGSAAYAVLLFHVGDYISEYRLFRLVARGEHVIISDRLIR
jgi:hypothetical protein